VGGAGGGLAGWQADGRWAVGGGRAHCQRRAKGRRAAGAAHRDVLQRYARRLSRAHRRGAEHEAVQLLARQRLLEVPPERVRLLLPQHSQRRLVCAAPDLRGGAQVIRASAG
jgi:hypothetical protein